MATSPAKGGAGILTGRDGVGVMRLSQPPAQCAYAYCALRAAGLAI